MGHDDGMAMEGIRSRNGWGFDRGMVRREKKRISKRKK
jgi:hypothetical protein